MNFWRKYIGDFQRDTRRLSLLEKGAYNELLDMLYATEAPLPTDHRELYRACGCENAADRKAVDRVLADYFKKTDAGYMQDRAAKEIEKAEGRRDVNKQNGKRGGRPPKTESVSNEETESVSETKAIQEPVTINQEKDIPLTPKGGRQPTIEIGTFLERCRSQSEKPIPENDPVFEYADSVGIPVDFLRLAWREFVERHQEGSKRYRDWRRAFRNCIRGNWYHLWWISGDGQYQLTTVGIQAQRKHTEAAA